VTSTVTKDSAEDSAPGRRPEDAQDIPESPWLARFQRFASTAWLARLIELLALVPVVAMAGQVLGVVSRADLIAKTAGPPATGPLRPGSRRERRRALARTVRELMTAPAVTIAPEATIGQAARAMRRHRIGQLPVTFRLTGRLAGIVTRADLLRIYLRPGEEIRAELEAAIFPLVRGVHPENLAVAVRYGIVSVWGRVENKSAISGLIRAI